jgi:alpha-beta hydrolase superfamily lysophospholipase/SAM-dependent methyltransferase
MNALLTPAGASNLAQPPTEHIILLRDGTRLFYRAWLPGATARKAVLLLHRGHEHSGRWQETVQALGLDDVAFFAWDARGHGRSTGARGAARDIATLVKDLDEFVEHIALCHGIAVDEMIVLGHSVGAVTAAAWVHDFAPPVRGLILATAAFRVKLYAPFARCLLRLRERLFGPGSVISYVRAYLLSHDPLQIKDYLADPLIFRQIAISVLLDLHDTSKRLLADAGAITAPTLLLTAGTDWLVSRGAQQRFFEQLGSPDKRMVVLPGFYHSIFHEKDRQPVLSEVRDFIRERFRQPPQPLSLVNADKKGSEGTAQRRPCLRTRIRFHVARLALKTVGRLSRGICLGWRTGFDSGITLDYVYENKPQGITPLSRWIDRAYLNSIGWRGIRERRQNLQQELRKAIEETHATGRPIRILDIASGPGRYVLEMVHGLSHLPISVMLRDYKSENVAAAEQLAKSLELKNVTVVQGDAFDRGSLATVTPRPTIAIVSGLYELFLANEPVLNSLRGLAECLEPGGFLIYTNQPWHPQLDLIAHTLINREGKPWIMRCRSQAEMDELVRSTGFVKVSQEIDPWGIFSVSLARKSGQ